MWPSKTQSKEKKIIQIRVEINELENRKKNLEKCKWNQKPIFRKFNKIDKPPARFIIKIKDTNYQHEDYERWHH